MVLDDWEGEQEELLPNDNIDESSVLEANANNVPDRDDDGFQITLPTIRSRRSKLDQPNSNTLKLSTKLQVDVLVSNL